MIGISSDVGRLGDDKKKTSNLPFGRGTEVFGVFLSIGLLSVQVDGALICSETWA